LVLGGLTLSSCKKEDKDLDKDVQMVEDNALAENEAIKSFDVLQDVAKENGVNKTGAYYYLPACASVSIDTISTVRKITIDFGQSGCLCSGWDGKYRKGKITSTWTGHYRDSSTVHTIASQDYYVSRDGGVSYNKHDFTKTVTNRGRNSANHSWFEITINSTVTLANGAGTINYTSTRVREWAEGESTPFLNDDVYWVSGTANGTDRNGRTYNMTTRTGNPVEVKLNCKWVTKGIVEITPQGKATRTVNYGNGVCDSAAEVTVNGITIPFTMP